MPRALWNGTVLAESDETIVVEGNHYFPPDSVNRDLLEDSPTRSVCPWKGTARYYHVVVNGKKNEDAAWCYPEPKERAERMGIKNHMVFWRGVEVET